MILALLGYKLENCNILCLSWNLERCFYVICMCSLTVHSHVKYVYWCTYSLSQCICCHKNKNNSFFYIYDYCMMSHSFHISRKRWENLLSKRQWCWNHNLIVEFNKNISCYSEIIIAMVTLATFYCCKISQKKWDCTNTISENVSTPTQQ